MDRGTGPARAGCGSLSSPGPGGSPTAAGLADRRGRPTRRPGRRRGGPGRGEGRAACPHPDRGMPRGHVRRVRSRDAATCGRSPSEPDDLRRQLVDQFVQFDQARRQVESPSAVGRFAEGVLSAAESLTRPSSPASGRGGFMPSRTAGRRCPITPCRSVHRTARVSAAARGRWRSPLPGRPRSSGVGGLRCRRRRGASVGRTGRRRSWRSRWCRRRRDW